MTDYEKIPRELREDNAWVNVWNQTKIPMQPHARKGASSTNPDTWGTFAEASENVRLGAYDGIGYVFHDNGIIGIDCDIGFDSDGFFSETAVKLMRACRSYTEVSRSGRGIHIYVRGDLPFKGKNNRAGVEIYKTSRFFIVTGKQVLYKDIIENQAGIDSVLEEFFQDTAPESEDCTGPRIYSPEYREPEDGKIKLRPRYPKVTPGGRNLSLASLAGQLHTIGYSVAQIEAELQRANAEACDPPLPASEVRMIVKSITRYRR